MNPWDAPLIKKGMSAQLAKRRARIAAGEKPLGWKVGLGAPATMQKMGLTAPVVGYLMQRALLLSEARRRSKVTPNQSRSRKSAYGWRMIFGPQLRLVKQRLQ